MKFKLATVVMIFLIGAVAGFAQSRPKLTNQINVTSQTPPENATYPARKSPPKASKVWKLVGTSIDKNWPAKFYYQNWKWNGDDVEVWIKIVPSKTVKFRKLRSVKQILSFNTYHCADERLTQSSVTMYDGRGSVVVGVPDFLLSDYEPIIPESVEEGIFKHFCG